jgi:hypothetical protein
MGAYLTGKERCAESEPMLTFGETGNGRERLDEVAADSEDASLEVCVTSRRPNAA